MTDSELSSLLSKLQESSLKLNNESNSINTIINQVELQLTNANPGIEFWLRRPLHHPIRVEGEDDQEVGFAKLESGWHLAVRDEKGAGPLKPLSQASREVRIEALKKLPALIEGLNAKVLDMVSTIESAKKLVF